MSDVINQDDNGITFDEENVKLYGKQDLTQDILDLINQYQKNT